MRGSRCAPTSASIRSSGGRQRPSTSFCSTAARAARGQLALRSPAARQPVRYDVAPTSGAGESARGSCPRPSRRWRSRARPSSPCSSWISGESEKVAAWVKAKDVPTVPIWPSPRSPVRGADRSLARTARWSRAIGQRGTAARAPLLTCSRRPSAPRMARHLVSLRPRRRERRVHRLDEISSASWPCVQACSSWRSMVDRARGPSSATCSPGAGHDVRRRRISGSPARA